jgi:hypothetical protein
MDSVYHPWTMPGSVHGGPLTMAGPKPHRSSAISRSSCRETTLMAQGGGGVGGGQQSPLVVSFGSGFDESS